MAPTKNDPGIFRTTITFDEQSDGKTVITLRQLHPTKSQRDAGIGFGAVEFGYQALDKLAQHVERGKAAWRQRTNLVRVVCFRRARRQPLPVKTYRCASSEGTAGALPIAAGLLRRQR